MELEDHKKVMKLVREYEKNPKSFNNLPTKELIMERINVGEKERQLAMKIAEFQKEIEEKMMMYTQDMMKLKGAAEYIEEKILEKSDK